VRQSRLLPLHYFVVKTESLNRFAEAARKGRRNDQKERKRKIEPVPF